MIKKLLTIALAGAVCIPAMAQKKGDKGDLALESRTDSVSYCLGLLNAGDVLKQHLSEDFGIDSLLYGEFMKGVQNGARCTKPKDVARAVGFYHGLMMSSERLDKMARPLLSSDNGTMMLNKDMFMGAFRAGLLDESPAVSEKEANKYLSHVQKELKERSQRKYREDNKAFLEENAKADGVTVLPSGLQYKVLVKGDGPVPAVTDRVKVHYRGMTIDGEEFDSSYKRNSPMTFSPGQVIKGWTEALTMMPVGSKWVLYIPQELGYGSRDTGPIKAYSTLIFEVELLGIE